MSNESQDIQKSNFILKICQSDPFSAANQGTTFPYLLINFALIYKANWIMRKCDIKKDQLQNLTGKTDSETYLLMNNHVTLYLNTVTCI